MSCLINRLDDQNRLRKGCLHKDRVKHALVLTGFDDPWRKIDACGPGSYCNSAYCRDCRERNVRSHYRRMIRLHREWHGDDDAKARENLRFVTVLNELCELDHRSVREALSRAKRALTSVRRSFPGLSIHGRFEIEAVDTWTVLQTKSCPRKTAVIRELAGGHAMTHTRDMALVHFHAVVFLNGHDAIQVRTKLSNKWPGSHMVQMVQLHANKSVEKNLFKVCSYMLKDRYHYNHRMDSYSYKDGNYLSNESLSCVVRIPMTTGVKGMMVYSKDKDTVHTTEIGAGG